MNLKELSENLGLSQTTVSRALNGYPEVSARTRKRVEEAAKTYNYSPSTRAKGLATGKALAIGHVIPVSSRHEMMNPVFGDFITGAGEVYAKAGYEMILSVVADKDETKVYESLKARRAVDGVIVHGPRIHEPRIALLDKLDLPFAVHGRAVGGTRPYPWLDVNNHAAFAQATSYLIGLGHVRIGLVNGLEDMDFAHRRRTGFCSALTTAGLTPDETLMRSGEMTEVFGYHSTRELLDQPDPPTAIVVSSMISALGVRRAIEDRGLVMGEDISVVTHDDCLSYLQNGNETPIFTATRSSVRDAGRRLATMLLDTIMNPDHTAKQELLEAKLVIGASTGPAPRKD
ncbi:MAG: substrate-binding domain-containing protein [Yoonia sp.]|uniref:substrate-binding domain-containing protein n=1 Tax=Yoonia sp. TaxID=2212373 RepID=UPI003EF3434E